MLVLLLVLSFAQEASLRLLSGLSPSSDVLACMGEERVAVHLPSADHLLAAVAHGWSRDSLHVAGCVDLRSARRAINDAAQRLNTSAVLVFQSGSQDMACLGYRLRRSELSYFHDSDILFRSVFPILDVLKTDVSVPHVLGYMEELGQRSSHGLQVHHPMQRDYVESGRVDLQVILDGSLGEDQFRSRAEGWVERAGLGLSRPGQREAFYWTSSAGLVGERPARLSNPFPLRASRAVEERLSALSNATHYSPQRHWRRWQAQWAGHEEGDSCGFHRLTIRYRRRSIHLRLPFGEVADEMRAACLAALVVEVSKDVAVMHLGMSRPMRLMNKVTRAIVQGDEGRIPFAAAGLDGSGVIVGQSDTGIDRNSCFFIDPEHGPCASSSIEEPSVDLSQRKVVQYVNFSGSSGDYFEGHGSHVSLGIYVLM